MVAGDIYDFDFSLRTVHWLVSLLMERSNVTSRVLEKNRKKCFVVNEKKIL